MYIFEVFSSSSHHVDLHKPPVIIDKPPAVQQVIPSKYKRVSHVQ